VQCHMVVTALYICPNAEQEASCKPCPLVSSAVPKCSSTECATLMHSDKHQGTVNHGREGMWKLYFLLKFSENLKLL
jgi:hypothetical protein